MKSKKLLVSLVSFFPFFVLFSFTYLTSSESEIGTTGRVAGFMSPIMYLVDINPEICTCIADQETTRHDVHKTKRNETKPIEKEKWKEEYKKKVISVAVGQRSFV